MLKDLLLNDIISEESESSKLEPFFSSNYAIAGVVLEFESGPPEIHFVIHPAEDGSVDEVVEKLIERIGGKNGK